MGGMNINDLLLMKHPQFKQFQLVNATLPIQGILRKSSFA